MKPISDLLLIEGINKIAENACGRGVATTKNGAKLINEFVQRLRIDLMMFSKSNNQSQFVHDNFQWDYLRFL